MIGLWTLIFNCQISWQVLPSWNHLAPSRGLTFSFRLQEGNCKQRTCNHPLSLKWGLSQPIWEEQLRTAFAWTFGLVLGIKGWAKGQIGSQPLCPDINFVDIGFELGPKLCILVFHIFIQDFISLLKECADWRCSKRKYWNPTPGKGKLWPGAESISPIFESVSLVNLIRFLQRLVLIFNWH